MKVLIVEPCLVNFGDDRGGVHVDACETPDVPRAEAVTLTNIGRAFYVDRKNDPSKGGANTATEAMLRAARETLKQRSVRAEPADLPAQ